MKSIFKLLLVLGLLLPNFNVFSQTRKDYFSGLDFSQLKTNVLYDLAKSHSEIAKYDGSKSSPTLNSAEFKQIYHEIYTASLKKNIPDVLSLLDTNSNYVRKDIYPIYILDYKYDKLRKDAYDSNLVEVVDNKLVQKTKQNIFEQKNVFVASSISKRTYARLNINFSIKKDLYFSNRNKKILYFLIDFDNGQAEQKVSFDEVVNVKYKTEGEKNILVKAVYSDNSISYSKFQINVKDTGMPWPSNYWTDTADIAYNGEYGVADVAVFLGKSNAVLTEPVIIVDGFDPGDSRPISGVYEIANQQHMVDTLRNRGMDGIIVNFKDGAGYIQKNAYVLVKIIEEINQMMIDAGTMLPNNQIVVVGPSMGGLITRYALDYMEHNGIPHNVRSWISFDSPQKGANVPLGLQHWVRFFADVADVEGAKEAKAALNTPAAWQMLIYHFTGTSGYTANPNSLKPAFYNEIDALGFPQQMRKVAIINGSGYGQTQPFSPGEEVIYYKYRSWEVDLDGDVWAVPNQNLTRIFYGFYDTALPFDETSESIYVNNTLPYDGAPGGTANTFEELAATNTGGYGNITAYYNDHCFIPAISSLALENTTDPLYNVDANINNIVTPFDKIYYPHENQTHVYISPESVNWFIHEIYNYPPQFTSTPALEVYEDSQYSYNIEFTDQNEWNTINVEILQKPDWLSFDNVNNVLSGTPTNDDVGTSTVKIKISDGLKSTIQEFQINVINTNDAPFVANNIPPQTAEAEYLFHYAFAENTFEDVDANDELTYSVENMPSWLSFDDSTRTFFGQPTPADTGNYTINVIATDNSGASANTEFNITVQYNAPHLLSMPPSQIYEDDTCYYQLAYDDPLGTENTQIEVNCSADWISFDTVNYTFVGTPKNKDVGTHNFSISLQNNLHTVSYNFNVEVINTNDAPYLSDTIPDYTFYANDFVNIFVPMDIFSDDDQGDELTYSTSVLPDWLNFNPNNLTYWGEPAVSDTGLYHITLYATDLAGASDSTDFNVLVYYSAPSQLLNEVSDYQVDIYPNPASDIVNIQFNSTGLKEVYIFDEVGKLVYSDFTNKDFKTYNLSYLDKGLYFVHIKNNDKAVVKKLIIEK